MKVVIRIILVLALIAAGYIYMKYKSWQILEKDFSSLYEQQEYSQAMVVAKRQLETAKVTPFFSKFYVPSSMNNLGKIYQAQGEYAQAETYYKGALRSAEEAFGRNNSRLAVILENMAGLYRESGNAEEAQKSLKRAEQIQGR
jgi:tetratricopeptide (TPR) repeat protein